MSKNQRLKVEKYIENRLKEIGGVEKFLIEKGSDESVDVVIVSHKLSAANSSAILDLERKINKVYKIPSDFKIYPIETW